MHRLVIWGFVLALIPLTLAVVWEFLGVVRALLSRPREEEPTPAAAPPQEPAYRVSRDYSMR